MINLFLHYKTYLTIGFIFFVNVVASKDQNRADSLITLLNSNYYEDTTRLKILTEILINHTNPDVRLGYGEEALQIAEELGDTEGIFNVLTEVAHAHRLKGNLHLSLEAFFEALKYAKILKDPRLEAVVYGASASVYRVQEDYENAINYSRLSLSKFREINDSLNLAKNLLNLGEIYRELNSLDSALIYYQESSEIFKNIDFNLGSAYNLGNIGLVLATQGKNDEAANYIIRATQILAEFGDFYPIAVYDTYMSDIYLEKGDFKRALQYAQHSLDISLEHGLKEQIRDASLKLSKLYELQQEYQQAHNYQKQYLAYRDSINNEETIRKMADLRTEYEVSQKQVEIDLLESRQRMQYILFASMGTVIILLAILAFLYYRNNKRKQMLNIIITERKEEVEAQRDQLEAMNETREKFLSIIAHDLLGPVNSFKGLSTIMRFSIDQNDTNTLNEIHTQFDKSVNGLSNLLTDLLDWSVTQQGDIPYNPEKVDLKELSDELINLFQNMAATKKIELSSSISQSIFMHVDRNSVKTILRNLVSNAIKFTKEGGLINLSATNRNGFVEISVIDTGIGMTKEKQTKLLNSFDYNRSWGTEGEKGLGLGLQLVKEFTKVNKGRMNIESEENSGTTITISLPTYEANS